MVGANQFLSTRALRFQIDYEDEEEDEDETTGASWQRGWEETPFKS